MTRVVTRWWMVRHAPVIIADGRIYGADDVPADVGDSATFERLATRLPREALLVTSHLSRTIDTAAAIRAAGLSLPEPIVERGLAEQDFGHWQGRTWAEISATIEAARAHKFWTAPAHHAPPGGESFLTVIERVRAVVQRLTREHPGRDIVAVVHGGTIRAVLSIALGLDPEIALGFATENLSTTRIDHVTGEGVGGDWRVAFVNSRL